MSEHLPITVLGAGGWIGSSLVRYLQEQGRKVEAIDRESLLSWLNDTNSLGPVIYTIGLTADFRQRPHATVDAHVTLLSRVMQRKGINQLLFISSTRVYSRSAVTSEEFPLASLSSDPSDLYNISKLMGEALVLQDPRPGFKVVRLSNVLGPRQPRSTFVGALMAEAQNDGKVTIRQSAQCAKDYVALDDVVRLLPLIAEGGRERLYNLGTGANVTHAEVACWLREQGIAVNFQSRASPGLGFPALVIDRLAQEFTAPSHPFRQSLNDLT